MFNSEKQKIICNHYKIEIRSLCSAMVLVVVLGFTAAAVVAGLQTGWDGFHIGIRMGCWLAGWLSRSLLHSFSLVRNGNQSFAGSQCRQRCIHGEDTILAKGRANRFGIDTLGQQELAIVFPVDALCVWLLLVLGVHLVWEKSQLESVIYSMHIYLAYQQLLIDSFHNNLLGRILADIETQLQHFVIAFILQKERVGLVCFWHICTIYFRHTWIKGELMSDT